MLQWRCAPLRRYEEVPTYLQHNPHILAWYRADYPLRHCLASIFFPHNELGNIWSHLAPGLYCLYLLFYHLTQAVFATTWFSGPSSVYSELVSAIALICWAYCCLSSAVYHACLANSELTYRCCLAADLCGICVGILGCYIPGVMLAFYCSPVLAALYIAAAITFSTLLIKQQIIPFAQHGQWRHVRILLFVGLVVTSVIPAAHWIIANRNNPELLESLVPRLAFLYCCGMVALALYLSRLPERLAPGWFDILGHSHQWWHIIIVISFASWYDTAMWFQQYHLKHTCTA